jgi:hypothetical protein
MSTVVKMLFHKFRAISLIVWLSKGILRGGNNSFDKYKNAMCFKLKVLILIRHDF